MIGEAADGGEAVEKARLLKPQVILMDLMMPKMDGLQAIAAIRQENPEAPILVLTSHVEDDMLLKAIDAGALGYLMNKFGYEPAPLVLGLVLGNMMESSLRRSMVIFEGSWMGFFQRPISAAVLILTILIFFTPVILRSLKAARPSERAADSKD